MGGYPVVNLILHKVTIRIY